MAICAPAPQAKPATWKVNTSRVRSYRPAGALLAVLCCALLLRLPYVTERSIWFDEAASWQTARLSVPQLLEALRVDTTLPLYYLMLKAWLAAFGDSPLSLRLSSISLGVLAVAGMYLFAIELYLVSCGRRAAATLAPDQGRPGHRLGSAPATGRARAARCFALAVALAVALSPFQINAAIEARMYALGTAVTAFTAWLLLRAVRGGAAWRWWFMYSGLAGFALYIHPYELFSIAAQFVFLSGWVAACWLHRNPRRAAARLRRVAASAMLVALIFLPAVPLLLVQHGVVHKGFWIVPLNQQMLASTLAQFVLPTYVDFRFEPYPEAILLCAMLLAALVVVARHGRLGDWFVVTSGLIPLALAAMASLKTPIWEGRYFRFAHLFLIALVMLAVWHALANHKKLLWVGATVLVVAGLAANVAFWKLRDIPERPGMRGAMARLLAARQPGELVVVENHLHFLPARYYLPSEVPVKLMEPWVRVGWARSFIHPDDLIGDRELASALPRGIWFIAGSKLAHGPGGDSSALGAAVVTESFIEHYDCGVPDWPIHVSHCPAADALKAVREIDTARCAELDDADMARFARLPWLRRLLLDGADVGDRGLAEIAGLLDLRDLSLADTSATDAGVIQVCGLAKLESLCLDGDRVSRKATRALARLPRLRRLSLTRTFVADESMRDIAKIATLEELDIDDTLVGDAGLDALAGLPNLARLSVRGTKVTRLGINRLTSAHPSLVVDRECGAPSADRNGASR